MPGARTVTRRPRTPATSYGVPEGYDVEYDTTDLGKDAGREDLPYCTHIGRASCFDPGIGMYVHADVKCWKPSKAYYDASLQAGVIKPPQTRSEASEDPARLQCFFPGCTDDRDPRWHTHPVERGKSARRVTRRARL